MVNECVDDTRFVARSVKQSKWSICYLMFCLDLGFQYRVSDRLLYLKFVHCLLSFNITSDISFSSPMIQFNIVYLTHPVDIP